MSIKGKNAIVIGERDGARRPNVHAICSRLAAVRASAPR